MFGIQPIRKCSTVLEIPHFLHLPEAWSPIFLKYGLRKQLRRRIRVIVVHLNLGVMFNDLGLTSGNVLWYDIPVDCLGRLLHYYSCTIALAIAFFARCFHSCLVQSCLVSPLLSGTSTWCSLRPICPFIQQMVSSILFAISRSIHSNINLETLRLMLHTI